MKFLSFVFILFVLLKPSSGLAGAACANEKSGALSHCQTDDMSSSFAAIFASQTISSPSTAEFVNLSVTPCFKAVARCASACDKNTDHSPSPAGKIWVQLKENSTYAPSCRRAAETFANEFSSLCRKKGAQNKFFAKSKSLVHPSTRTFKNNLSFLSDLCKGLKETPLGAPVAAASTSSESPQEKPIDDSARQTPDASGTSILKCDPSSGENCTHRTSKVTRTRITNGPTNTSHTPDAEPYGPPENPNQEAPGNEDVVPADESVAGEDMDGSSEPAAEQSGGSSSPVAGGGDFSQNPFDETDIGNLANLADSIGAGQIPDVQEVQLNNDIQASDYRVRPIEGAQIQAGAFDPGKPLPPDYIPPRFRGLSDQQKTAMGQRGGGGGAPPRPQGGIGGGAPPLGNAGGGQGGGSAGQRGGRRRGGSAYSKYRDGLATNSFYGGGNNGAPKGRTASKKDRNTLRPQDPGNVARAIPQAYDPREALRRINSQYKKGLKNYLIQVGDGNTTPTIFKEINYNYTVDGQRRPRNFLNSKGRIGRP